MRKILILFTILLFTSCSSSKLFVESSSYRELKSKINSLFEDTLFSHAHWGVLIKSLNTGETWYSKNSSKMFMPASNQKILTTAAALSVLGPDYKFRTSLGFTEKITDGILEGDLVITSNGDPTISDRFFNSPVDLFNSWADSLNSFGIYEIKGDIIGNDNLFDDERLGNGWSFDFLDAWYAAEIGPLQFNENVIDIRLVEDGDSILAIPNVHSSYFNIVNTVTLTDTGRNSVSYKRAYGTNNIIVSGRLRKGFEAFSVSPSISNPTLYYVSVLKEALEKNGIKVHGNVIDVDDIQGGVWESKRIEILLTHESPELKEILKGLMKRSQNLYAETMTRLLGLEKNGLGTFENGLKVVEDFLKQVGIKPRSYKYSDGSGLTRYNYISPEQIVTILEYMYRSDLKKEWMELFPIAGIDGTLSGRMKGTKAQDNVRAKTGTISAVRGLSGYLSTDEGEEIVFSFLINGHLRSTRETDYITDNVLKIIAEFNRGNY